METITVHAPFGKTHLQEIAIDQLHPGVYQPRDIFAQEALESLAKTIEQLGILEPLVVRPSSKNVEHYEIVAGERRWQAAKLAGLQTVPCLLGHYSDEQAAQIALVENVCREGLNPIAQARAMRKLASEFQYTHEEISALLGMSRTGVTNLLRLLTLDERIQHWMKQGHLSEGHGKILAGLPLDKQYWYAYEAIKKEWSVSMLDEAIKIRENKNNSSAEGTKTSPKLSPLEQQLTDTLGHAVKLKFNKNETGYIQIHFHDKTNMQEILAKLGCSTNNLPLE